MAFVIFSEPPEPNWDRSDATTSLIGLVGRDDKSGFVYRYEVGIQPLPGVLEFYFYLIQTHPVSNVSKPLWSGLETAKYIDRPGRAAIMARILAAARLVIAEVRPKSVFRCTRDTNLPAKSMQKHERINQVFVDLGYVVTRLPDRYGKCSWRAERS